MNVYLNLTKANYDGERDLLTLELPANQLDDIMRYVRPLAEQNKQAEIKVLKDIIKESIFEISRRSYERKSRKNAKR
ncbi:gp170 [Synechococcus phage syn9]|jgi:hypothetical protein|uniref:Gp170 n=1 Tax=Synechococcus phage syn9 TaxID=382359 RepID=Q0QZ55_BPSYS|nr:gp170 [Synechococcus phage syn9]ABA47141.1 gp170 [Synechococcus phage syn9]AGH56508.1 hypothetical protein CPUG_00014 [Cyanophage Syn10]